MKKWLLGFLIIFFLLILGSYIFIDNPIIVGNVLRLGTSQKAMARWLSKPTTWNTISEQNNNQLAKNDYTVLYNVPIANTANIDFVKKGDTITSNLLMLALGKDSMAFNWNCQFPVENNPISRIQQYVKAREIKKIFDQTFLSIQKLAADEKNISGLDVHRQLVADTFFIAKKMDFDTYPTTAQVYNLINEMRKYLVEQNAVCTDSPMLHINMLDSAHFSTMVALPTNKMLKGQAGIEFKRMVRGLILTAEVKGGPSSIRSSFSEFKNYVDDHGYTEIALPFQSMMVNRLQHPDSTEWITKLYYPVY